MASAPQAADTPAMADEGTSPVGRIRLLPFYLGGFLGPYGTLIIVPMLPDLRDHFGVDSATISWGISAYLLPMAGLMLISGTLGERFGRFRVLRVSLAAYLGASVLVAVAPSLAFFLVARALQGAANAFFTPLLLAGLSDITVEGRLGRRVGMYTSFQSVGGALAPFAGGLAATIDWRWAFWSTAAVTAVVLASMPGDATGTTATRPPVRSLLSARLLALALASGVAAAGPLGVAVLVGFKIRDVMGLSATSAGLVLAGGYVGAVVLGPTFGRLLDRFGSRRCGTLSLLSVGALVAAMGPIGGGAQITVVYLLAGSLVGFVTVVLHQAAAVILPDNRGGALSLVLSLRFFGLAVGPLIWVPVLSRSITAAFAGAGLAAVVSLTALLGALPSTASAPEPTLRRGELRRSVGAESVEWPARRRSSRPRP